MDRPGEGDRGGRILPIASVFCLCRWRENEWEVRTQRQVTQEERQRVKNKKYKEDAVGFLRWDKTVHCDTRN